MNTQISIIVPVYNLKGKLERCIDSVLRQSMAGFELLLIDDGSNDGSEILCDEYEKKDSRIKVYHKENGGVSSARNLGMEMAVGEFIVFVDGDDFVAENYLSNLYSIEYDLNICGAYYANPDGSEREICRRVPNGTYEVEDDSIVAWFEQGMLYSVWSCMFRKAIIQEYNIVFDVSKTRGEDIIFLLEYIERCKKVRFCEDPAYFYVQYGKGGSSSYILKRDNIMALDYLNLFLAKWFKSKGKQSSLFESNRYWIKAELRGYFYDVVRTKGLSGKERKEFSQLLYSLPSTQDLKGLFKGVNPFIGFIIKCKSPTLLVISSKVYCFFRQLRIVK